MENNESSEALDDNELALRAGAGHRASFAALLNRHYGMIFRVALRWSGDREDGEDIAQNVCVKLAGSIASFRADSRFTTWLYRLIINVAQDFLRAKTREQRRVQAFLDEAEILQGQGDENSNEYGDALWAGVRQLPDKTRDAVLLVYGEGLSHGAAAQILSCKEATISWHIHDAKKRLSEIFRKGGGDEL